jgi:hypothetical protein
MDDGDLNETIEEHVGVLENEMPRQKRFENDEAHLDPRYALSVGTSMKRTTGTADSTACVVAGGSPRLRFLW